MHLPFQHIRIATLLVALMFAPQISQAQTEDLDALIVDWTRADAVCRFQHPQPDAMKRIRTCQEVQILAKKLEKAGYALNVATREWSAPPPDPSREGSPQKLADDAAAMCDRLAAHRIAGQIVITTPMGRGAATPDYSSGYNHAREPSKVVPAEFCAWCKAITNDAQGRFYNKPPSEIYAAQIKVPDAVRACELAVQRLPSLPIREGAKARYFHQLGRAYDAAEDYPKALQSFKAAAQMGYSYSMAEAALLLAFPPNASIAWDPAAALQLAQAATATDDWRYDNGYGFFVLGLLYVEGFGVTKDVSKGYELLTKAAELINDSLGVPEADSAISEYITAGIIAGSMEEALQRGQRAGNQGRVFGYLSAALAAAKLGRFDSADQLIMAASSNTNLVIPRQRKLFDSRIQETRKLIDDMKQEVSMRIESIAQTLVAGPLRNNNLTSVSAKASKAAGEINKWTNDSMEAAVALVEKIEKSTSTDPLRAIVTSLNIGFTAPILQLLDPMLNFLIKQHSLNSNNLTQHENWVHPCIVVSTYSAINSPNVRKKLNGSLAPNQIVAVRQVLIYGLEAKDVEKVERKEISKQISAVTGAQFGAMISMIGETTDAGDIDFRRVRTDGGTLDQSPTPFFALIVPSSVKNSRIQSTLEGLKNDCRAQWQ